MNQGLHPVFFLKAVHTPQGGDDALLDFSFFFAVFDDLDLLVFAGFFDACEHGSLLNIDTPKIYDEYLNINDNSVIFWHYLFEVRQRDFINLHVFHYRYLAIF